MSKFLTTLELARFKTDRGLPVKLLERRRQPVRSFTKGFVEQLYICFARIPYTSPYQLAKDIDGTLVDMSSHEFSSYNTGGIANNLQHAAPGGGGLVFPYPASTAGLTYLYQAVSGVMGCDLGIQVGTDNTAATPSDKRLVKRIGHGTRGADGAALVLEEYNAGDDSSQDINAAATWLCQGFIPKQTFQCSSVFVKIYKAGAPGDLTVRIRGSYNTGTSTYHPSGAYCDDLATGTILEAAIPAASPGAQTECTFATPCTLYAGHLYFIVINAPGAAGANHVYWRYDNTTPTFLYSHSPSLTGKYCYRGTSADSGATWSLTQDTCYLFQAKGQSVGDFVHSGTEVRAVAVAAPSATFVIQKYFYNGSGGAISVNEVGMHGLAYHDNTTNTHKGRCIMTARDALGAPVAVANTELLVVTYTPSITV